ncbi:MAG TPA: flavodoxin-dependent (E)-4-hydroxy-3-methylbut-2-enyl-diphosphate synthase [Candidatus Merdivicinus faecavium]|nr:flavodoxin-dependent (E)-4-hydroxy-3-methylbut-2-enyl-diphosphate synthase [Candidatus Merdivicinus faecavium]
MARKVLPVKLGNLTFGDGRVYIQSMLSVPSTDIPGSVAQAAALERAGCEIIRAAIPDKAAVALIPKIKEAVSVPLVADIHFDYRLALEAVAAGVDKVRINPGNIGDEDRVKAVAKACAAKGVPIRIGVNGGSLEKHILAKYGAPTADALVESGLYNARLLEKFDFDQIVISLKSSRVQTMIEAYRKLAACCDYPLHLGVTEAGTERMGIIKSAAGIGALLADSIGETIRVSLTADPLREVAAARDILKALDLCPDAPQIVSCPTCGRTRIDLISLANEVEARLASVQKPIRVAVMGCAVNGPGEAREADIGVAGGDGCAILFKKGEILRKIPEGRIVDELMAEIEKM